MTRSMIAAVLAALSAAPAAAQDEVGTLVLTIGGEQRPFVLIQGADGPNPGSRYSRLGEDVVMTIVGVAGEEPRQPDEAEATVELRFTVDETVPEVRTGSVLSYSTREADGKPSTRGGTVEIALDDLTSEADGVVTSGSFAAQLPPDHDTGATDVEGTFRTAMKSREALD